MAQRFQFRLETVLRVRELREREARRKLGAKQAEIARLDDLNEQTSTEILAQQAGLLATQNQPRVETLALARARGWITHLRRTILERQVLRSSLAAQLNGLREEFHRTRTDRRAIEKLRERRFAAWKRDRIHREQTESDELASRLPAFNGNPLPVFGERAG